MSLIRPTSFWRQVSPRGAIADFLTVFRQAGEHRWRIAAVSAATTFALFSVMWNEGAAGPPPRPEVTFITSWIGPRSDAEIMASNIANQQRKDRLAAEEAMHAENVRQMYKTLGRYTGLDVDAMERKINEDRARDGLPPLPDSAPAKSDGR
ncbi:MAG: hypothetical protein M0R03_02365 [Novosphingobium sp.]|nr:hypothetical protein [Novosphingobium sp.]